MHDGHLTYKLPIYFMISFVIHLIIDIATITILLATSLNCDLAGQLRLNPAYKTTILIYVYSCVITTYIELINNYNYAATNC